MELKWFTIPIPLPWPPHLSFIFQTSSSLIILVVLLGFCLAYCRHFGGFATPPQGQELKALGCGICQRQLQLQRQSGSFIVISPKCVQERRFILAIKYVI